MKKRNQMQAVRMDGRVVGYVRRSTDVILPWTYTDSKRRKLGRNSNRRSAVKSLLRRAFKVEETLDVLTEEAVRRMDKKSLLV